jgi:hypothetical protein
MVSVLVLGALATVIYVYTPGQARGSSATGLFFGSVVIGHRLTLLFHMPFMVALRVLVMFHAVISLHF